VAESFLKSPSPFPGKGPGVRALFLKKFAGHHTRAPLDNSASTSRSPEHSRRGRIPDLFLPLSLRGRGSKVGRNLFRHLKMSRSAPPIARLARSVAGDARRRRAGDGDSPARFKIPLRVLPLCFSSLCHSERSEESRILLLSPCEGEDQR
jgi:hypothetical protein